MVLIVSKEERLKIVEKIEKERQSQLICYATSDRPNFPFPISMDATRLFNDHLKTLSKDKKCDKLDLLIYSRGGDTRVPWIIVRTFREYCNEFNVLVPFRAHSAATMIALGADSIIMGKEGELSPIDPTIGTPLCPRDPVDKNQIIGVNVADLTGYVSLVKEKVGITNQQELASAFNSLAQRVHPLALGGINRHLSFIRLVAKRLLSSHNKRLDESKINSVVDDLVEKTFFHEHTIGRKEAKDLSLKIVNAEEDGIEEPMWSLFEEYEKLMKLKEPLVPEDILDSHDAEEYVEKDLVGAIIESKFRTDVCKADMRMKRIRQVPQSINLNLNLQVPVGLELQPAQIQALQQIVQHQVMQILQTQQKQAPIMGYEIRRIRVRWERI